MEKDVIHILLETAAPVHIGCSEVYEPTGFTVDTDKNELNSFEPTDFIASLSPSEKQEFSNICSKGSIESIIELYRFMRGKPVKGRRVKLPEEFSAHHSSVLNLKGTKNIQQGLNNFTIERTFFRSHDQRPYIPGSSVKGAIRTAVLNRMASELNYPENNKPQTIKPGKPWDKKKAEVLENRLYEKNRKDLSRYRKDIASDPFRLVKVSDFHPVEEAPTRIFYCINRKRNEKKEARGPYQILETIMPNVRFSGTVTIEQPVNRNFINYPLGAEDVLESIRLFFNNLLNDEKPVLAMYNTRLDLDTENKYPLKCGRHTGAEGVTVEGYREISVKVGKKEFKSLPNSTTYWFASDFRKPDFNKDLYPMGWMTASILSEKEFKEVREQQFAYENKLENDKREEKQKQLQEAENLKEEQRRKKEAEEKWTKEAEAERKRKEEIEQLPEEQKAFALLDQGNIQEEQVTEIYQKLDSFPEEYQKKISWKLKEYYSSVSKWSTNKKKASKKQIEKVKKIKTILGES